MNEIRGAAHPISTSRPPGWYQPRARVPPGADGSPQPHPTGPLPSSLSAVTGQIKSRIPKLLWRISSLVRVPIWQRNYDEHIISNEDEHHHIYLYIEANPDNWEADAENPEYGRSNQMPGEKNSQASKQLRLRIL